MLGGDDDLTAVLGVLDRLSNELETNRKALDVSLQRTDEIGVDMPLALVTPEKQAQLLNEVRQETRDCEYLRENVDELVGGIANAARMARDTAEAYNARTQELHRTAGHELLAWQAAVEQLADECAALEAADAAVDGKVAKLLSKIELAGSRASVYQRPT